MGWHLGPLESWYNEQWWKMCQPQLLHSAKLWHQLDHIIIRKAQRIATSPLLTAAMTKEDTLVAQMRGYCTRPWLGTTYSPPASTAASAVLASQMNPLLSSRMLLSSPFIKTKETVRTATSTEACRYRVSLGKKGGDWGCSASKMHSGLGWGSSRTGVANQCYCKEPHVIHGHMWTTLPIKKWK